MTATKNLLDKYRTTCAIPSDKALAESLGIQRQSVFQWRRGDAWPTEDHVIAMASAIHESAAHWLPLIAADRAKNPEARRVWLRLAQTAAAVALMLSFGRLDVYAASLPSGDSLAHNPATIVYYVK